MPNGPGKEVGMKQDAAGSGKVHEVSEYGLLGNL